MHTDQHTHPTQAITQSDFGTPVLNEAMLHGVETLLGTERMIRYVNLFRQQLAQTMAVMESADDSKSIGAEAHQMVALAGQLGLTLLCQHCRSLMQAVDRGESPDTLDQMIAIVMSSAERSLGVLEARFPQAA